MLVFPFKVFRGIRQGCPASALIFVLAVEIMAIKLRETKHIRGIEIKLNSITGNLKICQLHSVINDHSKESNAFVKSRNNMAPSIRVITKLPNSEQSYKGKVQTHNYINRQNQSTTGKL
jgi:hypothetical protein